ncbi:small heat shock protein (HSP20) family protein [Abortiporus biennis]
MTAATASTQFMAKQADSRQTTEDVIRHVRRSLSKEITIRQQKRFMLQRLRPEPGNFIPKMDLYDDGISPRVSAILEIPGVQQESMQVRVSEGKLIIHVGNAGTTPSPAITLFDNTDNTKYKVRELYFGTFHREIPVPTGIEPHHIRAELTDGMLMCSWPRDPAAFEHNIASSTSYATDIPSDS